MNYKYTCKYYLKNGCTNPGCGYEHPEGLEGAKKRTKKRPPVFSTEEEEKERNFPLFQGSRENPPEQKPKGAWKRPPTHESTEMPAAAVEARAVAQARAQAVAQAKAEAVAQAKAEAVAQAKAEAVAQAKAEAVAQAKAEAEARAQAEAAAKAQVKFQEVETNWWNEGDDEDQMDIVSSNQNLEIPDNWEDDC